MGEWSWEQTPGPPLEVISQTGCLIKSHHYMIEFAVVDLVLQQIHRQLLIMSSISWICMGMGLSHDLRVTS